MKRRTKRRIQRAARRLGRVCLCLLAVTLCAHCASGESVFSTEHISAAAAEDAIADETAGDEVRLEVAPLLQRPALPNGCEATAMATVLQYNGFAVSAPEFAADWLPCADFETVSGVRYAPSPEEFYLGDPASESGWYCFEQPLADGANAYLQAQGSALRAEVVSGADARTLCSCLSDGCPVIVWITTDYAAPRQSSGFTWVLPSGEEYIPYINLHCVVLTGIEDGMCCFDDPLCGESELPEEVFLELYAQMGSRAVAVR